MCVGKRDLYRRTALSNASQHGYDGIVDMLLAAGADPARQDAGGRDGPMVGITLRLRRYC